MASETDVRFEGATDSLNGRVREATGPAWGALVLCHGRHEGMDTPLVAALAGRAAEEGLWTLRFNFAFRERGAEPSTDHADEIADLREAIAYARRSSGTDVVFVAGRGVGAWATVAAATDETVAGAILLGLSYTGQPERRMALQRLEEFQIPTLILVGFESERTDLPALEELVDALPHLNLEILAGADHRLEDAKGRPVTEAVLIKCDAWLSSRKKALH
ncbi:MAG TPA: alpha/beta family hydrolase [Thermoplasmata archaeon]|nr:alpha/beta family hydrolase [Thermoplasmata archaeon]